MGERARAISVVVRPKSVDNAHTKRLVADVPERIHRLVRMRCLQRGQQVRDYILELLAEDGIR